MSIFKNISLLFGIIIFLSFFQLYVYYSYFDIPLINFSSPYDLLFFFLPAYIMPFINAIFIIYNILLNPISIASVCVITIIFVLYLRYKKISLKYIYSHFKNILDKFNKPNEFKKVKLIIYIYIIAILLVILKLFIVLLNINKNIVSYIDNFLINDFISTNGGCHWLFSLIFVIWSIFVLLIVNMKLEKKKKEKSNEKSATLQKWPYIFISVTLIIFFFTSLKTTKHIYEVSKGENIRKIEFVFNDKLISTGDSLIYVGSTYEYVFLKNKYSNELTLYKMSDVKYFIYK